MTVLDWKDISEAAAIIKRGGLVAMPTETVYGLAADATDDRAVARIFEIKARPQFNPMIIHVLDVAAVEQYAEVSPLARRLAESSTQATREIADLVKVIQTETQDAVASMEQETQAVEAGSASALRTGEVFNEISGIAQRSSELAQTIASAAVSQTASTDQVGRSIRDFAGGAITTQKATDSTRVTVEDMAQLAEGLTVSVAKFKLA